ncbi:hypothetical protein D3C87_1214680 [compost metagenome]
MPAAVADAAHRLQRVDDQVEQHLLQFDTIALDVRQAVRQRRLHRGQALGGFATGQFHHLADCRVHVHRLLAGRRLLDQLADAPEHIARPVGVLDDAGQRLPHLVDIGRLRAQPAQPGLGVGHRRRNRLVDLVRDRRRQLSHGRHPVGVRQLGLHLAVAPLALAHALFGLLALGQVKHERHALLPAGAEGSQADDDRHPRAILADVLLLEWRGVPGLLALGQRTFAVRAHLRRGQVAPAHPAGDQILARVAHHAQEGVVGFQHVAGHVPDNDADDIGLHQPPDLRLPLGHVAVQPRVFERDGGLRGHQLQHRDPCRTERARREIVLQIERTSQPRLVHQRQAQDRAGAMLAHIGVGGERRIGRRIVQHHAFPGAQHMEQQ